MAEEVISSNIPSHWAWIYLDQECEFLDSQRVPVNEIERLVRIEGKPQEELYPYYGANGQVGWIDGYIFDEPLILLAEDGGFFGSHDRSIAYSISGKTWVNNHAHIIRPKTDTIDFDYCLFALMIRPDVEQLISGTTRAKLNLEAAKRIVLPFPPLNEQRHIAAILRAADDERRRRRRRRYTQRLSDSLLREIFVQMFGDPVTNSMQWTQARLQDVCAEIYRYPTFYGFDYVEAGVPIVRIGNILQTGVLDPNLRNYVYVGADICRRFPRTTLELNDTVMAVRGDGSTATRIGLVTSENLVGANISPNLLRFKAKPRIMHPLFLYRLLVSEGGQQLLDRYVTRTAKKTITAQDIKEIKVPLPDYALQEAFVEIAEQHEQTRLQEQESARQGEHLFQTLLHQAFRGEL